MGKCNLKSLEHNSLNYFYYTFVLDLKTVAHVLPSCTYSILSSVSLFPLLSTHFLNATFIPVEFYHARFETLTDYSLSKYF